MIIFRFWISDGWFDSSRILDLWVGIPNSARGPGGTKGVPRNEVVISKRFDSVFALDSSHVQTLMLTDVQTPFLGTCLVHLKRGFGTCLVRSRRGQRSRRRFLRSGRGGRFPPCARELGVVFVCGTVKGHLALWHS